MIRQSRQSVTHCQNIADEQPRHKADQHPQRKPRKAQQYRQQPAGEYDPHRPQAQQVAEKANQCKAAEIICTDRRCQGQTPCRSRNAGRRSGSEPAVFLFCPHEALIDFGRQPQQPRHRPERQLETDGLCRKGIGGQNQEQRSQQCCGWVAFPPEQGRRRQQAQHDAGPHHRGGRPGEQCVKYQNGNGHRCRQMPPVLPRQELHQRQQIGAVHPADRQNVVDTSLGEIHVRLRGQLPFSACQQRQQKPGVIP